MNLARQLLALEERFWKGDAEFYRQHLSDQARMVFQEPVGLLDRTAIVESIATGSRWERVTLESPEVIPLAEGAVLLTYRADAAREGQSAPYGALASSVYVEQEGAWKLAFHQQTPRPPS